MDSYLLFAWCAVLGVLFAASALIVWTCLYIGGIMLHVWRIGR